MKEKENTNLEALLAEVLSVVQSTKDRDLYRAVIERIPAAYVRRTLERIRAAPAREIGHPNAYFFNAMVTFAHAQGIELPEPVNRDCYVPLCQGERLLPPEEPLFCLPHWHEFQTFQPEHAYDEAGIIGYEYESREPWLRALSYADWRLHVFVREKELDTMVNDP